MERQRPLGVKGFNINISYILLGNFIEMREVLQKIFKFFLLILFIFINYSDFLIFPCFKEVNSITM